jgi:MFS family permease
MWRGYTAEPVEAASPAASDARSETQAHKPTSRATASVWSLFGTQELLLIAVVVFVGQYVERTFWPLAPLLVVEMEPGSEQLGLLTGLVLGIGSGATALSALVVGRLARRCSARVLLLISLASGCVTLPLLVMTGSFWAFVAVRVVMGLLTGGVVTLAYAHVSTLLPSDRLSATFSMFASVAMVASAVGPVSMSTMAATGGLRSPLLLGAAGFAVCFVWLLVHGWRASPAGPAQQSVGLRERET